MLIFRFIFGASTVTCLQAFIFKKLSIFLVLPVLQHLFSPSVLNPSPVCSDWLAGSVGWSTAKRSPFGILAIADHSHAQKPLQNTTGKRPLKSTIGPL